MGEVPTWWRVVQAARYLRVAPWDLAERPMYWVHVAEEAQNAEDAARKARERKDGATGGGRRRR